MFKFINFLLFLPCCFLFTLDFLAYQHRLEEVNLKTGSISLTLKDSSVWETSSENLEEIKIFQISDPVIVTANNSWFQSEYPLRVINQRTLSSINIKTLFCPLIDNPFARFLTNLDLERNALMLNDSLAFSLNSKDLALYQTWQEGDFILIGINSEWLTTYTYPVILINLSTNSYVRAAPF